ncbi:hydrogenase maturation protease [Corynebacterium epidermidicanis]
MGDDAVGLELLARVHKEFGAAEGIKFVDGGTAGLENLTVVQDAEGLLLLDALAGPGAPGSVVTLEGDQIPRLLQSKLSPHQVGLLDLLSAARLLGTEPARVGVVGVVVADTQLHVGMTEVVTNALPAATAAAVTLIQSWVSTST